MKDKILISKILKKVKDNKKYKYISDEVVVGEIEAYLGKNKGVNEMDRELISKIRAELHQNYASFQTRGKSKIEEHLKELKEGKDIDDKLLSVSVSTKERLKDYEEIYENIFKITRTPSVILDLGGGFNVFSFPYMNLPSVKYYSYDISDEDIKLINKYSKIMKANGLEGKAEILNIKDSKNVEKLPKSDVVFLFKVLDVIDDKGHKTSEELIKTLFKKTKFIVASFATRTITRKKMNYPNRKWFELMCDRNSLNFKSFKTNNEVFYIVEK